jgi:uridine kinase
MSKPLVIGVAGGSGSGKTTVVNYLCDEFSSDNILSMILSCTPEKNKPSPLLLLMLF